MTLSMSLYISRPLKSVQFRSSSRKTIRRRRITAGIYGIFRGLNFESDAEIEQKGSFFNGLASMNRWIYRSTKGAIGVLTLFLLVGISAAAGQTKTITLPITIDYPLLQTLTIQSAFNGPNQTARLLETEDGCTAVTVSNPRWAEKNGLVRFEVYVDLEAGKFFNGNCLMPVTWQGYVVSFQQPEIDPANWQLTFKPVDMKIYDRHHQPTKIPGIISQLMTSWVYPYLNQIRIDLAPPVEDLKQILLPMFPDQYRQRAQKILDSLRPGNLLVESNHVRINILVDAEVSNKDNTDYPATAPLSKSELDRFIKIWETWDALLVHMILSLSGKSLSEGEQQILLDTLLETRHRFSAELANDQIGEDFVKMQFLWAWEQIAPIFHRHLSEGSSGQALGYLTFFTASDALAILDELGPALGIEISREGLIRLARLLGDLPSDSLEYRPEADHRLRQIFGFEPIPKGPDIEVQPGPADPETPGTGEKKHSRWQPFIYFLVTPRQALAVEKQTPIGRLKPWIVPKSGIDDYLGRIKKLLKQTAEEVVAKSNPLKKHRTLYQRIVYATAWQESCFRQFHTKNRRLVYLRSYNGSSVGLMQINERVWRGIYDLNRLRWDIRYNARAGCEILATYFHRYALKRFDQIKSLNPTEMAGVVYAMYNGGPGQFKKFLSRLKTGKGYLSDRLFREKYTWVTRNQWTHINQCLVSG